MSQGPSKYPLPASREEFERLLASPEVEERLRVAMASFQMQDPTLVGPLARRLAAEGHPIVKATLVKAVGRFQVLEHLKLLGGFLSDPDDRVRANTVEALGFYKSPEVVKLINPMITDPSSRVRGNAMLVLGKFDRARTLKALEGMALAGEAWKRETAIYVLGRLGGPFGASRLGTMFLRETDPRLRKAIADRVRELSKAGDPAAQQVLGRITQVPPAAPDLDASGSHVKDFPPPTAAPAEDRPVSFPEDLESPDRRRRLEAVQLAPDAGDAVFVKLWKLIENEKDEFVLATLVKKVGVVGGEAAVPLLAPFLDHPDGRVRANTLEGLEATGAPEALDLIKKGLEDEHPRVKAEAARILASRNRDQGKALSVLKDLLIQGDESGALSAVHALEHIDAGVILEILELALVSPRPKVKQRVLAALDAMGQRNVLARRLADRYAAGDVIDSDDHINRLLSRMNSKDQVVRHEALKRLAMIDNERARTRIELATSDASEKVRNLAKSLVEDFGRAYKRQGVLHSLGLRGAEAVRDGKLELAIQDELARLDAISQALEKSEDGVGDAPEQLAARRELFIELGERIYRERPGCELEGVKELLAQARDLDAGARAAEHAKAEAEKSAAQGAAAASQAENSAALRDVLREVKTRPAKNPTGAHPRVDPKAGGGFDFRNMGALRNVAAPILAAMAVLGVGWWLAGGLISGLFGMRTNWVFPTDGECQIAFGGGFVFGAFPAGEVTCLSAPNGTLKWKRQFQGAIATTLLVDEAEVFLATALSELLSISGPKGEVTWSAPLGGKGLPRPVADSRAVYLGIAKADGTFAIYAVNRRDGAKLWSKDLRTGEPSCLTLDRDSLYFVSGSTVYHYERVTGTERWSFDYEEDFLKGGRLALSREGSVYVATASRVISLNQAGFRDQEGPKLTGDKVVAQPYVLGDRRVGVFAGGKLIVYNHLLEEAERLDLAASPDVRLKGTEFVYFSDSSQNLMRLRLQDGKAVPAGKAQLSGLVRSLAMAGNDPVVSTHSGVELVTANQFE